MATYDWCIPASNNESYFVKSVANTAFMTGIWDPHIMRFRDGKECVTTVRVPIYSYSMLLGVRGAQQGSKISASFSDRCCSGNANAAVIAASSQAWAQSAGVSSSVMDCT